ncbi:MAG: ROK family protein [Phycisphaerae bacterium]|nr:ROK family protein [Saprospiraceae bacterium]
MQHPLSIGTDIGGTHITCAAVKIQEGELLTETLSRATYKHEASAEVILQNWAKALNSTLSKIAESQLAGIGFAIPGPFDYRNGVSKMEHKFKNLYGLHIPSALNPLLTTQKELPMRFLNDATSFAVGEAWTGEGRGFHKVVVITLGTGFGSAFTEDGVPVVSGETVPKEGCLWHLPFKDGIADDYFSTRWFIGEYQKQVGVTISGVKELIEKTNTDAVARNLFLQFGQNLADCLAEPLQKFGAEVLIIGGNIAHALPLFGSAFRGGLDKSGVTVKVVVSKHSEHAALIGSARLLDDVFWEKVSARLPNI